jgi:hypothetical protein
MAGLRGAGVRAIRSRLAEERAEVAGREVMLAVSNLEFIASSTWKHSLHTPTSPWTIARTQFASSTYQLSTAWNAARVFASHVALHVLSHSSPHSTCMLLRTRPPYSLRSISSKYPST